jgi:hypothetical protein
MSSRIAAAMNNIDERSYGRKNHKTDINPPNYNTAAAFITSLISNDLERRSKSDKNKCLVDFPTGGKREGWILFSYCKHDANSELFKYLSSTVELTFSSEDKIIDIPLGTIISGINLPEDPINMGIQTVMYRLNQLLGKYGRVTIVHEEFTTKTHTDILNKYSEFNVKLTTGIKLSKDLDDSETEKAESYAVTSPSWADQEDDMRTIPTFPSSSKVTKNTIFHIVFIKSNPKKNTHALGNR